MGTACRTTTTCPMCKSIRKPNTLLRSSITLSRFLGVRIEFAGVFLGSPGALTPATGVLHCVHCLRRVGLEGSRGQGGRKRNWEEIGREAERAAGGGVRRRVRGYCVAPRSPLSRARACSWSLSSAPASMLSARPRAVALPSGPILVCPSLPWSVFYCPFVAVHCLLLPFRRRSLRPFTTLSPPSGAVHFAALSPPVHCPFVKSNHCHPVDHAAANNRPLSERCCRTVLPLQTLQL